MTTRAPGGAEPTGAADRAASSDPGSSGRCVLGDQTLHGDEVQDPATEHSDEDGFAMPELLLDQAWGLLRTGSTGVGQDHGVPEGGSGSDPAPPASKGARRGNAGVSLDPRVQTLY